MWDKFVLGFTFSKAVFTNFLFAGFFLFSGITYGILEKWRYRYPLLIAALAPSFGLLVILTFPSGDYYKALLLAYLIPTFLFFSVFLAIGLQRLMDRYVKNHITQVSLLAILLLSQVAFNFPSSSHHNDNLSEIWGTELLNSLEPSSILIICGPRHAPTSFFSLYYLQLIRGIRQDVTIYDRFSFWTNNNLYEPEVLFRMKHDPPGYRRKREQQLINTSPRPVYYTCKEVLDEENIKFSFTPFVFQVNERQLEGSNNTQFTVSDRLLDSLVNGYPKSEQQLDGRRRLIFSRLISYFGGNKRAEINRILEYFTKTELYSNPQFILSLANNLYYFKNYALAERFYARAEELSLESFNAINLAVYCNVLGNARNYDKALEICLLQEKFSLPCVDNTINTRQTIAAIYQEKGDWSKVARYSRRILECQPDHLAAQNYLQSALQRIENRQPTTELITIDESKSEK